ncbi:hypothetical protein [Sporomusa aerivorans]|uniref:hypothetical protein n=1 Tax=Sporomusa aerivorans TaxID=204936 RepID=UPI00352BB661
MNIEFELDYLSLLVAADKSRELANEAIILGLNKSAREVQAIARAKHRFRSSPKANLEKSIEYEVDAAKMEATVSPTESVAPYALFVHEGTKPHQILPRAKKALRWASGGKFVFAKGVWHPGTQKDQFLYEAGETALPKINQIFSHAVADLVAQLNRQVGGA